MGRSNRVVRRGWLTPVLVGLIVVAGCGARDGGQAVGSSAPRNGVITAQNCPARASEQIVGDEILIGNTSPKSGPFAAGGASAQAFAGYIDEVNDEGGVPTANGPKRIKILAEDDQYTPSRTQQVVRRLVESDQVVAMASMLGSATSASVAPYLNQLCVPQLWNQGNADSGVSKDYPFSTQLQTYALKAGALGEYLEKHYPKSTVGVMYAEGDVGTSVLRGLESALKGTSVTITEKQSAQVTDAAVTSQMRTLVASGADTLVVGTVGSMCTQVLNAVAESSWRPHILLGGGCDGDAVRIAKGVEQLVGHGGIFNPETFSAPTDTSDTSLDDYRAVCARLGIPVNSGTLTGYVNGRLLVETIRSARSLTPLGIAESAVSLQLGAVPGFVKGIGFAGRGPGTRPITQQSISRFDLGLGGFVPGDVVHAR